MTVQAEAGAGADEFVVLPLAGQVTFLTPLNCWTAQLTMMMLALHVFAPDSNNADSERCT